MRRDFLSTSSRDHDTKSRSTPNRAIQLPPVLTVVGPVPARLTRERRYFVGEFWAALLLLLDDCNLPLPQTIDIDRDKLEDIAVQSINRWVQTQCPNLKHIHANVSIRGFDDVSPFINGTYIAEGRSVDGNNEHGVFLLEVTQPEPLCIGTKLKQFDKQIPKISQTILYELARCSRKTIPLFLPQSMLEILSYLYWYGDVDESTALEQLRLEGMDDETIDAYCPWKLEDLTAHVPSELLDPQSCHCNDELERLLSDQDNAVNDVISAILALRRLIDVEFSFFPKQGLEQEVVGFSTLLRWSEDDPAIRIVDDLWEQFAQTGEGYFDLVGLDLLDMSGSAFKDLLANWSKGFAAIAAADHLIDLVSEPIAIQ